MPCVVSRPKFYILLQLKDFSPSVPGKWYVFQVKTNNSTVYLFIYTVILSLTFRILLNEFGLQMLFYFQQQGLVVAGKEKERLYIQPVLQKHIHLTEARNCSSQGTPHLVFHQPFTARGPPRHSHSQCSSIIALYLMFHTSSSHILLAYCSFCLHPDSEEVA